ncbi:cytochrome c oxidase assembly protein COX16 homolog, mitochondrial [Sitophilus oryzae]|uniref:Cytochrome c oxidase assembly protein COX16 homolog, mitochondrial n=1 Tax=Sitophilus oryzae TaxID=7048 RepID=A0A6J2YP63_SITOR|nr:cytochrome c oxidase assembly protein COX16 homolog, mitochondrial [Sitophilus oryzae]
MNNLPFKINISKFLKKRSVKYGVPFLLLMLGGSFGLKEFTNLRYQFRNVSAVNYEEAKKLGIDMKKPGEVTLESEYEKIKNMDIDNWEQVRGPRPWEEKDEV